jgi:UDP-2,3-diacylglucosamine pyrophosphatase LpxH
MRVAVLSDLHLSSRAAGCAFEHTTDEFLRFLDRVADQSDVLVIAGDLFDTDVSPIPFQRRRELARAEEDWAPILHRLGALGARTIVGNHDLILAERGVPEVLTIEAAGRRLVVIHGHQFYPASRTFEAVKYPVKWLAGRARARGAAGRALESTLHGINDWMATPSSGPTVTGSGALRLLRREPNVDFVVCGHEHTSERVVSQWGVYANSGTCGFGRFDWVLVDLAVGRVEIRSGQS